MMNHVNDGAEVTEVACYHHGQRHGLSTVMVNGRVTWAELFENGSFVRGGTNLKRLMTDELSNDVVDDMTDDEWSDDE